MTIKPRLLPVAGAAFLSIAVAGPLAAKEPAKVRLPDQVLTDQSAAAAPAAAARSAAARTATVAEPSAAELEDQLRQMTSESSEGLAVVRSASGGRKVALEDRFMSVMVALPTEDGHTETSCVTGDHAMHVVKVAQQMSAGELPKKKPAAAAAKLEEK